MTSIASLFLVLAALLGAQAAIDADKAAELSREIREHFRLSGANWVSPKMLGDLDLKRNKKPMVYILSSRSCADCREFMASWTRINRVTLSSLTAQFLSVLVLDDYMLDLGPKFSPPNGDYLPRVFFADPDGELRLDWTNPGADSSSPFYYGTATEVVENMRRFLHGHWQAQGLEAFPADLQEDIA